MGLSINQFVVLLWRDLYRFRIPVVITFFVVSIVVLATGVFLPKVYSSYAVVHADQTNIIRPLMEGTAVATGVQDQSQNAREKLFSRSIMERVLRDSGIDIDSMSELETERLIDEVQKRTTITSPGKDLIRIEYRDPSPEMAFRVAQKFSELFVTESTREKRKESQGAYDFIDKQVREYHKKLTDAESRLKEFRSDNIDGTASDSFKRISELRRKLESTRLEISEERIKERSLEKQLSGEADVTRDLARDGAYGARIAELQMRLDTLRLQFHDSYPDIVEIKNQITELRKSRDRARDERRQKIQEAEARGETYVDESIANSPLYQELRSELSRTRTRIATLQARVDETEVLLAAENERIKRINESEATLAELTRDYEVNRDLYQDLLRRREKARVSMHLDIEGRGLKMSVQEPARLSRKPYGLRFMHMAALGIPAALLLPLGFIAGLLQVDRRVRSAEQITERLGLPIAGEIMEVPVSGEREREKHERMWMAGAVLVVFFLYLIAGALKWFQVF